MRQASLAIIAGLALGSATARAQTVDPIVAVVDGDAIRESEVRAAVAPYRRVAGATGAAAVRAHALDRLIDARLIEHAAARDGIAVTDAEVDAAIDNVRPIGAVPPPPPPTDEDRRDLRAQLLRFRVLTARMSSRVSIAEDQVRARYDELVAHACDDARIDIAQITLPLSRRASTAEIVTTRDRADALRASLARADEADDVLHDAGAVERAAISPGTLDPELRDELRALEAGDVSRVVFDGHAFVIVVLGARHCSSDPAPDFASVRANIVAAMRQQALQDLEAALMDELRSAATIERR
jgi:parvulin-like peptidyl-prolyl isomerase